MSNLNTKRVRMTVDLEVNAKTGLVGVALLQHTLNNVSFGSVLNLTEEVLKCLYKVDFEHSYKGNYITVEVEATNAHEAVLQGKQKLWEDYNIPPQDLYCLDTNVLETTPTVGESNE